MPNTRSDDLFTITERVYDAYGALNYLSKYPFVAADRVALMGFSAGGMTALEATKIYGIEELMTRKFKAAVAYYPTCSPNDSDSTVPTLIIGELDGWGPPALCRQRLANLNGSGPEIRLTCILELLMISTYRPRTPARSISAISSNTMP
ncbi:prolyl oligopeptidase family serine peptidase [Agrobacterium pusense]|uniref:dienelactone hydrolase family protein n=1 Tax=Agrobacterium pusense TaxID=648995 RepID=UPI002867FABA|nr:prolyl oligopeptidase family serine peptidase [Agrobacterium pusense]WMW58847.1 prolyl oligopeptidase family serine peptidase [Agrobacterium pusense]